MRRRGYTLIEMLVVITVSTVMMGIAVQVLYLLARLEYGGREHVSRATIVARLADQFRSDVHAALRPIPTEAAEKNQWQFALAGDRAVTYRALPGEVERREQVAGKPVRQESYALPADSAADIVIHTDPAPAMASLVITLPGTASAAGQDIRIDAVLSRDHRFAKPSNGSP
jgi:prepilin-type N-terminal cleavage/methylation domain-containing protein